MIGIPSYYYALALFNNLSQDVIFAGGAIPPGWVFLRSLSERMLRPVKAIAQAEKQPVNAALGGTFGKRISAVIHGGNGFFDGNLLNAFLLQPTVSESSIIFNN